MKEDVRRLLSTDIESFEDEIWEDIEGYEGRYMISTYARVKSIINKRNIVLSKSISCGRFKVTLVDRRGRITSYQCGRLVAKTFKQEPEPNEVLRYLDGNVLNDHVDNVDFITREESAKNRTRKNTSGERNGMAILTANQVKEIRMKRNSGILYKQLQSEYNVSIGCIHNIVTGKQWKTV
ncbi:NUMOD4 domain-containing protein [Chryseobacterium daeguense]|uniref:NUMOD4 domain-containing protein n=1 Tax=Chryseobacterium daeguense TaxID=412438 RepID=UPI0004184836|nr:NUMOD4 domain-containing protein [Chryseobacterium daeguense]